jgi:uncharacterized protein YjbI with pentapeptide repeats
MLRSIVKQVVAPLRRHVLLILAALVLLAVFAILGRSSVWPLAALAGVLGLGLLVLMLWKAPKRQASGVQDIKDRLTVENTARQTLAQIVGGAVLIAGLFFTWANLDVAQKNIKITQETATKNQAIAREGQITDRFTKAIAQLGEQGPKKLAVRLGGIYALERIAKDSKDDHWPIMEVLTAYVRETAPRRPKPPQDAQPSKGDLSPQEEPLTTQEQRPPRPAADIQAILTVLGQRTHTYENGEQQRLNLAKMDLRGTYLRDAQLQGAVLTNAQLQKAVLRDAQLQGAVLWGARLQGADLTNAQLQKAVLRDARLQGAVLRGARLEGADLTNAQLQKAVLWGARLQGAVLRDARLEGADLQRAQLEGTDLRGAQLQGADLQRARLEGAVLWGAQLQKARLGQARLQKAHLGGAQLEGADLGQADLQGTDLGGAQLQGANLEYAQLQGANLQKTLYKAHLNPLSLKQIQQQSPHLLEEPRD